MWNSCPGEKDAVRDKSKIYIRAISKQVNIRKQRILVLKGFSAFFHQKNEKKKPPCCKIAVVW